MIKNLIKIVLFVACFGFATGGFCAVRPPRNLSPMPTANIKSFESTSNPLPPVIPPSKERIVNHLNRPPLSTRIPQGALQSEAALNRSKSPSIHSSHDNSFSEDGTPLLYPSESSFDLRPSPAALSRRPRGPVAAIETAPPAPLEMTDRQRQRLQRSRSSTSLQTPPPLVSARPTSTSQQTDPAPRLEDRPLNEADVLKRDVSNGNPESTFASDSIGMPGKPSSEDDKQPPRLPFNVGRRTKNPKTTTIVIQPDEPVNPFFANRAPAKHIATTVFVQPTAVQVTPRETTTIQVKQARGNDELIVEDL